MPRSPSPKVHDLPPGLKRRSEIRRGPEKLRQLAPGWSGVLTSEYVEKKEMYMLTTGFVAQMQKRITDSEDESAPTYDGNRLRRYSPDEEAQKDWAIILVDSLD